jgi:DNA excision repair protein ERCC-4
LTVLQLTSSEELYKRGGLFSVTSKILVHDFLSASLNSTGVKADDEGKTVPAKLITGLVILHAEK